MKDYERLPLVYIAGPYTLPTPTWNVGEAVRVAEDVESFGCAVVIPHLSHLWDLLHPAPLERWYARDLQLLDRCDALVRFGGESRGADQECFFAEVRCIPVFHWSADDFTSSFKAWVEASR